MPHLVSVAVPVPLLPALTYRVPSKFRLPEPGVRVRVPLGKRIVTGCVVGISNEHQLDNVRDLVDCLDSGPFLTPSVLKLALWVSEYYACGPGPALAAAMPPHAWVRGTGSKQLTSSFKSERFVRLISEEKDFLKTQNLGLLGSRQKKVLDLLVKSKDGLASKVLASYGITNDTLRRMVRRKLIIVEKRVVERNPLGGTRSDLKHESFQGIDFELTDEQQESLKSLTAMSITDRFKVALLHGVTGSGKTEVYRQLAITVHGRGRRVLILVPEIALTPVMVRTFYRTFGNRVAIQHSGLSDGERHDQWYRIRRGEIDVVIGTRSGVFAPLEDVGLIVVDEEHETSYKQEEIPRYHGRDVAIMRGRHANALVLLGSATPSMESYHNAITGRYERVLMSRRIGRRSLPVVRVVDMRQEMAKKGSEVVLSEALQEALEVRLARKEQALILLNRKGYATSVMCRQCGQLLQCPNCSVALTFYRSVGRVRCHYCNYWRTKPSACLHCAGPFFERLGIGTERVEAEVMKTFPKAKISRLDQDSISRPEGAQRLLSEFERHKIDVLVGTQMIAKGHDFPTVTLVGVISADVGLGLADFRSAERTYQLLTQVSGRAGRGDLNGEAIIQTFYPDHYSIGFACNQKYEPFFLAEMKFRKSMRYPPVVSMVSAIVRADSMQKAMRNASDLVKGLRNESDGFQILGPAPAPISRLRGEHRAQIFLKGNQRRRMREALQGVLERHPKLRRRVTVDVDPLTVL